MLMWIILLHAFVIKEEKNRNKEISKKKTYSPTIFKSHKHYVEKKILKSFLLNNRVTVLQFSHDGKAENPLSYILLLTSFILTWIETWFLDFKVLPTEKKILLRGTQTSYLYQLYLHWWVFWILIHSLKGTQPNR